MKTAAAPAAAADDDDGGGGDDLTHDTPWKWIFLSSRPSCFFGSRLDFGGDIILVIM